MIQNNPVGYYIQQDTVAFAPRLCYIKGKNPEVE